MGAMNFIIGGFFILLGFLVKKYPNLIAGYNTMSLEQKKRVDIDGLSNHMRNSLIAMGCLLIVANPVLSLLDMRELSLGVFFAIVLVGTLYMVIKAQTYSDKK